MNNNNNNNNKKELWEANRRAIRMVCLYRLEASGTGGPRLKRAFLICRLKELEVQAPSTRPSIGVADERGGADFLVFAPVWLGRLLFSCLPHDEVLFFFMHISFLSFFFLL
jgi:hypothetical protein